MLLLWTMENVNKEQENLNYLSESINVHYSSDYTNGNVDKNSLSFAIAPFTLTIYVLSISW